MNKEPIENIVWKNTDELDRNDYNPNVVLNAELKLLKLSILKSGWIQPILIDKQGVIIDGFHRYWLSHTDKEIQQKYNKKVPCVELDLDLAERMLLTVRINRAKGNHIAVKMHELVTKLHKELGLPKDKIAEEIGATADEVELLLKENVFKDKEIDKHKYSRAWVVKV